MHPDMSADTWQSLYPFPSRFMYICGNRYHYVDEGAGHPVIMVHGNPTWSFYYRNLINYLSSSCRCLAPDHIGCGLSDTPSPRTYGYRLADRLRDLEVFIDRLNLTEPFTLVVHDWGGMIGTAYAVRHPEAIRRMIVTNTAAFTKPQGKSLPFRLRLIREFAWFARPAILGFNLFSWLAANGMGTVQPLPAAVKAGLTAPYNTPSNRIATLRFVQDIPLSPADPSYPLVRETADLLEVLSEKPMLILWGAKDFVFDSDYYDEWLRRFPGAQAHLFNHAGHYLFEDVPREAFACIGNFMNPQHSPNTAQV
ncbi:MAG: alpha/beta hydrolase [Deltaproteobacteria bacterium]|nr:MAG: alpha/beta hydrolase [Deltaproteobacteria bacterium]